MRIKLTLLTTIVFLSALSIILGVLTTYTITIPGTWTIDIDTGTLGPPTGADLWWEIFTMNPLDGQLVPNNGAEVANLGIVDFDSICDASQYSLSTDPIPDEELPDGTVLVIKTDEGKYAKMRIDSFGYNLDVTVVYQDDGSPYLCSAPVGGDIQMSRNVNSAEESYLLISTVVIVIGATFLAAFIQRRGKIHS